MIRIIHFIRSSTDKSFPSSRSQKTTFPNIHQGILQPYYFLVFATCDVCAQSTNQIAVRMVCVDSTYVCFDSANTCLIQERFKNICRTNVMGNCIQGRGISVQGSLTPLAKKNYMGVYSKSPLKKMPSFDAVRYAQRFCQTCEYF